MTAVGGVLLRYNGGHRYIGNAKSGKAERFIRIDTDHQEMAEGLCQEYIDLFATPAETVGTTGTVLEVDHVPSHSYKLLDRIDGRMLQTYAVTMKAEAEAEVTLELEDKIEQDVRALERRIERASRGVATLFAVPQINEKPESKGNDKHPPPYSLGQVLYPSRSPVWSCSSPYWVAFMEVTLETPGSDSSLIRLWKNTGIIGEAWIHAGVERVVTKIQPHTSGVGFAPKDIMICEIKVAGQDASNLAVVVRGAMTGD